MKKAPKAVYYLATIGSKTARGGEVVTASTGMVIDNLTVARLGDKVRYPDGSETTIVSGAGFAMKVSGVPVAITGSELENGDQIRACTEFCVNGLLAGNCRIVWRHDEHTEACST